MRTGDHIRTLLFLIGAILPGASSAQGGGGTIVGRVQDDQGKPVGWAHVRFVGTGREGEALGDGTFRFDGVPPGAYGLETRVVGYFAGKMQGVIVEPGRITYVEFRLEKGTCCDQHAYPVGSPEFEKELQVRTFLGLWGHAPFEVFAFLISPEFSSAASDLGSGGIDLLREQNGALRRAFPYIELEVLGVHVEGNRVVACWEAKGVRADSVSVHSRGMSAFRVEGGRIVSRRDLLADTDLFRVAGLVRE